MAISSINIQTATAHCFAHNDRSDKVTYLVDDSAKNECDRNAKQAKALLLSMVKDAHKYRKENGLRAMKSDTVKTVEAVVNLNAGHTLADVQRLAQKIEQEFGFRAVQIAVHRDEGKDKQNKNYHAHIVMCNLRPDGTTILRTLGKNGLSKLQDLTASELKMTRGDPLRKAIRLEQKEYKLVVKKKESLEADLQKERQEHEKTLKKLLEAQKEVRAYQTLTHTLKMQNKALSDANKALSEENKSLKNELELLKAMYNEDRAKLKESGTATQKDYQELKRAYDDLKLENELLKSRDTEDMLKAFVEEQEAKIHAHTPKLG